MTTSSEKLTAEGASSWDDLLANPDAPVEAGAEEDAAQAAVQVLDVNGDSSPDVVLIDTDQDSEPEAAVVDVNADGTPDVLLIDSDEDQTPDVAVVDLEAAGVVTDPGAVDADLEPGGDADSTSATD